MERQREQGGAGKKKHCGEAWGGGVARQASWGGQVDLWGNLEGGEVNGQWD